MKHRLASQRGTTLLELVVVIGIIGILLTIGIPSYSYVTTTSRISGEVNSLFSDMQFARADAIREGANAVICISADGNTCMAAPGTNWNQGWIICSDTANTGTCAGPPPGGTQAVWRYQPAFPVKGSIAPDTFIADNNTSAVSFNREGFATLANAVTIKLHDSSGNTAASRCLRLEVSGAVSTQTPGNGNCT